jgi:hypothetical protein
MGIFDQSKQYANNVNVIHMLTGESEGTIRKYCNSKRPLFAGMQALVAISASLAHAAEMGTRMPWLPPLPVAKPTPKFCPHCGKEI